MSPWWVRFADGSRGCVEAPSREEAMRVGAELTGKEAKSADTLPYPASPRLNEYDSEKWGVTPSFCYRPNECAGRSSCSHPHGRACND